MRASSIRKLDAGPYLDQLDALGREAAAARRGARRSAGDAPPRVDPDAYARVMALNEYLFSELRFVGNNVAVRRSAQQLPERSARSAHRHSDHAGAASTWKSRGARAWTSKASTFPGISSLRCPRPARARRSRDDLIIDAHHGGALLSEDACRELLRRHAGEDAVWRSHLLGHATKPQILARMLLNLKRVYVRMYSFPQARDVTELLLAVDPSAINELRDRGLLAYHLKDFSARAARSAGLPAAVRLNGQLDEEEREEQAQIWEHVKTLRRRSRRSI